jgi:hypothetical protein
VAAGPRILVANGLIQRTQIILIAVIQLDYDKVVAAATDSFPQLVCDGV